MRISPDAGPGERRYSCIVNIGEVCSREVYIARASEPLAGALAEMHKRHVGALVIVKEMPDRVRPVGVITDRDAIRAQVLRGRGLSRLAIADAMSAHPLMLPETCGIPEAISRMSARGVRRARSSASPEIWSASCRSMTSCPWLRSNSRLWPN